MYNSLLKYKTTYWKISI